MTAPAILAVEGADLPDGDTPIFMEEAPAPHHKIPLFGDDVWSLEFLNAGPAHDAVTVHWSRVDEAYRDQLKLAAWALINVPFPDEMRIKYAPRMRRRLGAFAIYRTVTRWRLLTTWLQGRSILRLRELTPQLMDEYLLSLKDRGLSDSMLLLDSTALFRLWVIGLQIAQLALGGQPSWLATEGASVTAPWGNGGGENRTEPIAPETMGPLIYWAVQMVERYGAPVVELHRYLKGPVIRASDRTQGRYGASTLDAYLAKMSLTGRPLPSKMYKGKIVLDYNLIACLNHVTVDSVRAWSRRGAVQNHLARNSEPSMLKLAAAKGGPALFPEEVATADLPRLISLIEAAAFVVVAYLTGMRVGEVLSLTVGSLAPASGDGGWHLIRARHFKTVTDSDGVHDSRGEIRPNPWVAIAPVTAAIRVLEDLRDGEGLLFPAIWRSDRKRLDRARSRDAMADAVRRLIAHINEIHPGAIPPDPHGPISPARFRRTLAWHIANRPQGTIALAIQYGHLRTAVSEGYAGRVRGGLQGLVDVETARWIALGLSEVDEQLRSGVHVSGPAATRLTAAARQGAKEFGGMAITERQARALLSNPQLTVYNNESALVWCNFRPETALCLRGTRRATSTPRLERCHSNCTNIARTDAQVSELRQRAEALFSQSKMMPDPAARRLREVSAAMMAVVNDHEEGRTNRGHD